MTDPRVTISRAELDSLTDAQLWARLKLAGISDQKPIQYAENADHSMTYSQGDCRCASRPLAGMTDPIEEVFRKHGKHAWKGSAEYTLGDFREAVSEILAEERKTSIGPRTIAAGGTIIELHTTGGTYTPDYPPCPRCGSTDKWHFTGENGCYTAQPTERGSK